MERIKCITFDKEAQDSIPKHIKDKMKADRDKAEMNRYLFWYENEGKEGWTFEIEAKDYDEAYQKAYDTHGPQVSGMMYQLL